MTARLLSAHGLHCLKILLFGTILWLVTGGVALAQPDPITLTIPAASVKKDANLDLSILVDKTDNLAGIKLVLTYDPHLLAYQGMTKSSRTATMMHVINDKQPGRLVIVMAAAQGVAGTNFPLCMLRFKGLADQPEKRRLLTFKTIELMSDKLEAITGRAAAAAPQTDGPTATVQ